MKNVLMHFESPFLNETIVSPESAAEHAEDFAGAMAEEAGCGPDGELHELESGWFDAEAWSANAEQIAFRDQVLARHQGGRTPGRDLRPDELAVVPGTGKRMRADAAAAAGRMLAAANAALSAAQQQGDADALKTVNLTATSGYRSAVEQRNLWLKYFPGYYKDTRAARERLPDGPHSPAAVAYMLRSTSAGGFGLNGRIAAPGHSNHQNGIAIDLWQQRTKGNTIENSSRTAPRAKWRATWFHAWLRDNASNFGFQPLSTEEWHWEYRPAGGAGKGPPIANAPVVNAPTPIAGKPAVELVRFAQRVLNAVEGERLADDGDFGPRSRAAVERFRQKHGLGAGGLDDAATLALAQRALEELAQASMFAHPGRRDARTDEEIARFKSQRGLPANGTIDAATRRALTDALALRAKTAGTAKPRTAPVAPSAPTALLGGKLSTFHAQVVSTPVAVFVPPAALGRGEVDVVVFAHGLLHGCPRPSSVPDGIIASAPFRLGAIVAAAKAPVVLVVPLLDWNSPGGARAFGKARPRWHELAKPSNVNALVAEALAEAGRAQGAASPSLRRLAIAGHSRAYDFLEPLAHLHADPAMQQGALAKLTAVWSFDATYAGNVPKWQQWLAANPLLHASVFYRTVASTKTVGDAFARVAGDRLTVVKVPEGHCAVPGARLPALLTTFVGGSDPEVADEHVTEEIDVDEVGEVEGVDGLDEVGGDDEAIDEGEVVLTDDEAIDGDDELEAFAAEEHECCRGHEVPAGDDFIAAEPELEFVDETTLDDEGEVDDEDGAEGLLTEDEAGIPEPLAVPPHDPVPFAPLPPPGSYWPLRTSKTRVVAYKHASGVVGGAGRMFLADRRTGGKVVNRWHVGIDLLTPRNTVVVACEAGTIVEFKFFYKAKSGQSTYMLLIEHDSGVVANYGEVTSDSLSVNGLAKGMRVQAGQVIGKVSDNDMLHFEMYATGTTRSFRWMMAAKRPPALLNPTRYLLHLAQHGLLAPGSGGGSPPPTPPAPAPKASNELVRFAQRVLNAAESERLAADGKLGKLTNAAVARFRQKYGLGGGAALDQATTLALAQRALEELAQASMFAQTGTMDARTREELAAFRAKHGLGVGATLDAATRRALGDALERRSPTPPPTPTPNTPNAPLPTLPGLSGGRTPPADPGAYRKFRLTTYHVVEQSDEPTGAVTVPIYDQQRNKLADVSPSFFAKLSLEGTGRLTDGRLINVASKEVAVDHAEYAAVLAWHERAYAASNKKRVAQGKAKAPTSYSGIVTSGGRVVRAMAFHEVAANKRGFGYGVMRDVPYTPFRTLAADIGHVRYKNVEKTWKGKGGLVPVGTRVYIKEYDGLALPDGTTHDGWFVVNDTGGAIFGAHFDVFTGTDALRKRVKLPPFGQVWFDGIEQRIPRGYSHGLDK